MEHVNSSLYHHCCIQTISHNNARNGPRYTAFIRLDDNCDRLKRTPIRTLTSSSLELLSEEVKKFVNDLPFSLSFAGPDMVDYYKKFISDKTERLYRYQYKNHWVKILIASLPKENKYFLYQPSIELPHRGGLTITGSLYETEIAAIFAAAKSIDSWGQNPLSGAFCAND